METDHTHEPEPQLPHLLLHLQLLDIAKGSRCSRSFDPPPFPNTQTIPTSHTSHLPYLLVAVAELRHVAKVHVSDAAVPQAEDVAGVGVTVEQTKLQQLPQTRHNTNAADGYTQTGTKASRQVGAMALFISELATATAAADAAAAAAWTTTSTTP
jgi:hypothetical protein